MPVLRILFVIHIVPVIRQLPAAFPYHLIIQVFQKTDQFRISRFLHGLFILKGFLGLFLQKSLHILIHAFQNAVPLRHRYRLLIRDGVIKGIVRIAACQKLLVPKYISIGL